AGIDWKRVGGGPAPPPPAFLGITGEDADDGARITQVVPNTPAAKGGLKPGDVVIAAGTQRVEDFFDLTEALRGKKGGEKLSLRVRRDKMTQEIAITLDNPRAGPQGPGMERFALTSLLGAVARDAEAGVRVGRLVPRAPASRAGLQEGALIKAVDKKPIANGPQLLALLQSKKPGEKVTLTVVRKKENKEIALTVPDPAAAGRGNPRRPN